MKNKHTGYVQKKIDVVSYKHFSVDRISISGFANETKTHLEIPL